MIETSEQASRASVPSVGAPSRSVAERVALTIGVVLVYGLLAVMLVFVMPGLFGFKTYTGIGSSMGDTIPDGSLIVTRTVDADEVEVGDVIAFRWVGFEHDITHRVVEIRDRAGTPVFVTRGDGNATRDPFLTSGDQQIREVIFTTPHLGTYLPVVRSLIYVLAFFGGFILWRRRRRRRLEAMEAMREVGSPSAARVNGDAPVPSDADQPR